MASSARRRNPPRQEAPHRHGSRKNGVSRDYGSTSGRVGRSAWLAPPIGVAVIVGLAYAAARAQATTEIVVAAALMFSLAEGVVLALVGWTWSRRGVSAAMVAGAVTAAVAAPVRWEVSFLSGTLQSFQPVDLAVDLCVSVAWGALAGLAGATVLHSKLSALMHSDRERFLKPKPKP